MPETIILRFRDLVTPPGGTINEHRTIAARRSNVWWGWWKRQKEICPLSFLRDLHQRAVADRDGIEAFVFDSGTEQLYSARLHRIAVAPEGGVIATPDPTRTPSYYQLAEYAGWFLFSTFTEVTLESASLTLASFPTYAEVTEDLRGRLGAVSDLTAIREADATLCGVTRLTGQK